MDILWSAEWILACGSDGDAVVQKWVRPLLALSTPRPTKKLPARMPVTSKEVLHMLPDLLG